MNESCDQSPDEDLVVFVKQLQRTLKKKGKDVKKVGESLNNSLGQHHDKLTSGRSQRRFADRRDKSSSSVPGGICWIYKRSLY